MYLFLLSRHVLSFECTILVAYDPVASHIVHELGIYYEAFVNKCYVYLQIVQQLKDSLNGEVTVMGELTTVDHHHGATSMCSDSGDMCLQGMAACHHLWVRDDVGDIGLVLIHAVDDDTQVLAWTLLILPSMVGVLLPLTPVSTRRTNMLAFCTHNNVITYFSSCMCLSKTSLSHFLTVGLRVLFRASLMAAHTSHLENLLS